MMKKCIFLCIPTSTSLYKIMKGSHNLFRFFTFSTGLIVQLYLTVQFTVSTDPYRTGCISTYFIFVFSAEALDMNILFQKSI